MPPRVHVVLDEHGNKKLVRYPLGGFYPPTLPRLANDDYQFIEKIRLTGRLAHGAFGDHYVTNCWDARDATASLARVFELVQGEYLDEETAEESRIRRHRLAAMMQADTRRRSAASKRAYQQRLALQQLRRTYNAEWRKEKDRQQLEAKQRELRWALEQKLWDAVEQGIYTLSND